MRLRFKLLSAVLWMTVFQVHAQKPEDFLDTISDVVLPGVSNIRIGLGPIIGPTYEGSDDYKVGAAPLISLRYRDFIQIDNNHIRINIFGSDVLFGSKNFKAGPLLKLDFGRKETSSNDLAGLGNVGTSIELGLFASYSIDPVQLRIQFRQDVASGHSGRELIGGFRVLMHKSDKFILTGSISTDWADGNYMDSFFSVTTAQSLGSGLAVFDASSVLKDFSLDLGANYKISDHWAIVANTGYARLLGDARDSPIVAVRGTSNQFVGGVFVVYSF